MRRLPGPGGANQGRRGCNDPETVWAVARGTARRPVTRQPVGWLLGWAASGDVGRELNRAEPEKLQQLYEALDLEMVYQHEERAVDVSSRPARRVCAGVRGGVAH
ncbi:hypothetical protein GCM10017566_08000 [Amycolatopsis bartoniae]|uniref:Uncharacterized protein n=1 Tax=Amycolatopsis bartoniae TaxID=941986 RepID=A0A8H9M3B1_9PSEU|nr:hypothetical protein GCM10017566_08000 [Amycolatopsis bartoniae]